MREQATILMKTMNQDHWWDWWPASGLLLHVAGALAATSWQSWTCFWASSAWRRSLGGHCFSCGPASGLLAHDAGALAASDTQRILKPFVMVISPSAEDSGKAQGSGEAMGSCRGGSSVWPLLPSPREVADALGPESSAKKSNGLDDKGMVLASSREHYSLVNAFMKRGVPIL